MKKIRICGGRPLFGEITVSGSKNAALPILFACILTRGVTKIKNLPDIGDVRVALEILSDFGAIITREGDFVSVNTENLAYVVPKSELVSKIRASTYLIGSCLSRFGICHIQSFGGCNFASRPIDMHLSACSALGCVLSDDVIKTSGLRGNYIYFDKPSVGATVNAILLGACARGETHIFGCAVEPHIDSLIDFLRSCGASIIREERQIHIVGSDLHGGNIRIIGDMIEAASYLACGLMTDGEVRALGCPIEDMRSTLQAFEELGAEINLTGNSVSLKMGEQRRFCRLIASPYPGFPTDLQPIIAPLFAKLSGGEITDTVWPTRFGYLQCLSDFGVRSRVENNRAIIEKSKIHRAKITSPDLRGAFACLMTALSTSGESVIYSPEIILRGYENIETKLRALGARITINQDKI